jgi:predicted ester cyclase
MTITYILEPAEEGTKLTYGMDYEMPWGILGKGLDKLGHGSGEKTVEKELDKLKSILEKRILDRSKKREGYYMPLEENKAIIRRWFEAENKKDLSPIEDIVAPDFFDHTHQLRGLEEYKQRLNVFIKAFPDFHETIEDIIAWGDKVWVRFKFSGTHTGEYLGRQEDNSGSC